LHYNLTFQGLAGSAEIECFLGVTTETTTELNPSFFPSEELSTFKENFRIICLEISCVLSEEPIISKSVCACVSQFQKFCSRFNYLY